MTGAVPDAAEVTEGWNRECVRCGQKWHDGATRDCPRCVPDPAALHDAMVAAARAWKQVRRPDSGASWLEVVGAATRLECVVDAYEAALPGGLPASPTPGPSPEVIARVRKALHEVHRHTTFGHPQLAMDAICEAMRLLATDATP